MRIMPFMKRKKGVQFAGTGLDTGGTTDYTDLSDKPQINGVTLTGNKTLADLGAQSVLTFDDTPTVNSNNPVKSGGVASELTAINNYITKNDLGTVVDLTTYSDVNNTYTAVADGYVRIGATDTGLTGYTAVTIYSNSHGIDGNIVIAINDPGHAWASNSIFVKKGMRMYCSVVAQGQVAVFYPLV